MNGTVIKRILAWTMPLAMLCACIPAISEDAFAEDYDQPMYKLTKKAAGVHHKVDTTFNNLI